MRTHCVGCTRKIEEPSIGRDLCTVCDEAVARRARKQSAAIAEQRKREQEEAERHRLAYLKRTGRTEMKP